MPRPDSRPCFEKDGDFLTHRGLTHRGQAGLAPVLGMPSAISCMPPGGLVYLVLNRGVGRRTRFKKDGDFLAFEKVVEEMNTNR